MSDKRAGERLLICNCQKTMDLDGAAVGKALAARRGATGNDEKIDLRVHRDLCRRGIGQFEQALAQCATTGERLHVACTQEAPLFREVAEEKGFGDTELIFTNIRERAGWCENKASALPKISALLENATYEAKPANLITINSGGTCLVYGAGQAAMDVAQKLSEHLSVTLLLRDASDIVPPGSIGVPINKGHIKAARGTFGAFEVEVEGYASMLPSSKAELEFDLPRDKAKSNCDLIFDMSGGIPLFSAHSHRDGYVHVDPKHPAAVLEAMFKITDYVGEFEKPLYINYQGDLCAHARSGQVGCTKCLDNCPAGALTSDGDHIRVDSNICGGCGSCSAVCPTGAIDYAYPGRYDLIKRMQELLKSYRRAGGKHPRLLLHDESHGSSLISALARYGKGLPANLLPLSVYSVFQIGHDALAAMLGCGAEHICILAPPDKRKDLPALQSQTVLMDAFLTGLGFDGNRMHIITDRDPELVESTLYGLTEVSAGLENNFDPVGSKRDVTRNALAKLHASAPEPLDIIDLPAGAPYGVINIDTKACTLCLACIGACPVGALTDNAERPEVSFTEAACVQCGVCVTTCPEQAITLSPRYNFTQDVLNAAILNSEEPFECIVCAKPFGAKSSIEKVVEKLKDHPMFAQGDQIKLIQMCDNCRIVTQANSNNDPFSGGHRPLVRTTEDYLTAEAKAKTGTKDPDDFLT